MAHFNVSIVPLIASKISCAQAGIQEGGYGGGGDARRPGLQQQHKSGMEIATPNTLATLTFILFILA